MNFILTPTQANIVLEIGRVGKRVWIVGGAVRDNFMDLEPKDLDFATNYDHDALVSLIKRIGLTQIPDRTAYEHGIIRVVDQDTRGIIDIAHLQRDDTTDGRHAKVVFTDILEEDLARRDFTINAMAAEIDHHGRTHDLIDLFNGQEDIEKKIVRFVGKPEERVTEDFLRMVRACRFTARDDEWSLDVLAEQAIIKHADKINTISKERIRDEIVKALGYNKPSSFFRYLHSTNLLASVFSALERGVGVTQNEYHAETVFNHLLRCLDCSVPLTNNIFLRLAALTHDIAKPHTRSIGPDGRVHFYKHEVEGTAVIYAWMRNLKFTRKQTEYVTKLVRYHQFRFDTTDKHHYRCKECSYKNCTMKQCPKCKSSKINEVTEGGTSDKTLRKWLSSVGPEWRDLITLRMADRQGNLKKADRPAITQKMRELMHRVQDIIDSGAPIFKEDLAISGDDFKEMGIKPGRIYREIFSNILGIVIGDPEKNTKEWLTNHVRKVYVNKSD